MALQRHLACCQGDRERSYRDAWLGATVGPANQSPQPCGEFAQIERLTQIIVRAAVEAFDAVLCHRSGRQDKYRGGVAGTPQVVNEIEPQPVRKTDIDNQGVIRIARSSLPRIHAGLDKIYRMPFEREAGVEPLA